jgi:hypothetical protein
VWRLTEESLDSATRVDHRQIAEGDPLAATRRPRQQFDILA